MAAAGIEKENNDVFPVGSKIITGERSILINSIEGELRDFFWNLVGFLSAGACETENESYDKISSAGMDIAFHI